MADEIKKGSETPEPGASEEVSEFDETILQSEGEVRGGTPSKKGPYLVIVDGPHQGLRFSINDGDNTIGRVMGSEVLLEDQSVSRRHAIITRTREGFTVEDCGSKNGTFVNGQHITEKVTIGHGDVIQAGIYSLRIFTKEPAEGEELKPLPPDWEGKTIMTGSAPDEITKTVAEAADKTGEISEEELRAAAEQGVAEAAGEGGALVVEEEITGENPHKRPVWFNLVVMGVLFGLIVGAGAFLYFKFLYKPKKPVGHAKPPVAEEGAAPSKPGEQLPRPAQPEPPKPVLPPTVPVFLDFASSPLTAKVTFQDKDYGQTPVKIQARLEPDKQYSAEALFDLREIGETYKEEATFTTSRDEPLVPVFFKGPIGVLKVMELPRDVELYLEGYFVYNPFTAKTAKLSNVVFGKPVYIPYGKYVIELRKEKELAGSGDFINDIRYRREILVTEDSPVFELKITDGDLNEFPVEVLSIPTNADVFIDANLVGKTPYKGIFPLGEHLLSLRKEGYFEYKQDLKMDKNIPVKLELEMKTTEAGEYINAGKHQMQNGRYKEGIDKLTEVFKHSPTEGETAQARYLIGSCFIYLGDLATAEDYFKQSVENPEMKYASMLGLVSVYQGQGRREEAIPLLVDVMLNCKDQVVMKEANTLFQQVSPLRSIMYVHTDPEGAQVVMNDKVVGQLTPLILPDLSLGTYKLRIEKEGYIPQDLSIKISVNEFNPVVVELKKVPE